MNVLKKVLQHWENGVTVCVIGKEVATNNEFIEEFESEDNTDDPPEETASHADESDIGLENESDATNDGLNGLASDTREIMESPLHMQEVVVGETRNIDEEPNDNHVYNKSVWRKKRIKTIPFCQ